MKERIFNVAILALASRLATLVLVALFISPLIHSAHSPDLLVSSLLCSFD